MKPDCLYIRVSTLDQHPETQAIELGALQRPVGPDQSAA